MKDKSLTLLETIFYIAILSLALFFLYILVAPTIQYIKKTKTKTEVEQIKKGLQMYFLDVGTFPSSLTLLVKGDSIQNWKGPYVSLSYNDVQRDAWGRNYVYCISSVQNLALVLSYGRNNTDNTFLPNPQCSSSVWPSSTFSVGGDDIAVEVQTMRDDDLKIELTRRKLRSIRNLLEAYYRQRSIEYAQSTTVGEEFAVYDPAFGAPRCSSGAAICTVDASVIGSRGNIFLFPASKNYKRGEPNQPNTLDAQNDGAAGEYLDEESVDKIWIRSLSNDFWIRSGDRVRVEASVHCNYGAAKNSYVSFWSAKDAKTPSWSQIGSKVRCDLYGFRQFAVETEIPSDVANQYAGVRVNSIHTVAEGDCSIADTDVAAPPGSCHDTDDVAFYVLPASFGNFFPPVTPPSTPQSVLPSLLGIPSEILYDEWGQPISFLGLSCPSGTAWPYCPNCNTADDSWCGNDDPPFEVLIYTSNPNTGEMIKELARAMPSRGECPSPAWRCAGGSVAPFAVTNNSFACLRVYRWNPGWDGNPTFDPTNFKANWERLTGSNGTTPDGYPCIDADADNNLEPDTDCLVFTANCGDRILITNETNPAGNVCGTASISFLDIFTLTNSGNWPTSLTAMYYMIWTREGQYWGRR